MGQTGESVNHFFFLINMTKRRETIQKHINTHTHFVKKKKKEDRFHAYTGLLSYICNCKRVTRALKSGKQNLETIVISYL